MFVSPNTIFSSWRGTRGRAERDKNNKGARPRFRFFFVLPCWFVANSSARLFHFISRRRTSGRLESAGEVAAISKRTQTLCLRTDQVRQKKKSRSAAPWFLSRALRCISHPPFWIYTHKSDGISTPLLFHRSLNPQSLFLTPRLQRRRLLFPSGMRKRKRTFLTVAHLPAIQSQPDLPPVQSPLASEPLVSSKVYRLDGVCPSNCF